MTKTTLKPCPFCGSDDLEISDLDEETCIVDCKTCLANGGYYPGDESTQPHEAAALWNKRADRISPTIIAAMDETLAYFDQFNDSPGNRTDDAFVCDDAGGLTVGMLRTLRGILGGGMSKSQFDEIFKPLPQNEVDILREVL